MSKPNEIICDRCGQRSPASSVASDAQQHSRSISFARAVHLNGRQCSDPFDFCQPCWQALLKYLSGPEYDIMRRPDA